MIIIKTLIATLCLEIIIFSTFKHTTLPFPPSAKTQILYANPRENSSCQSSIFVVFHVAHSRCKTILLI